MSLMPVKTAISAPYPDPDNDTARAGFGALWDALYEATEKPELDVASATTVNIGGQLSAKLRITGATGPITSFGTTYRGPILIRYAAAVAITHNPTTLILPGGANLTTSAGGTMIAYPKATAGVADGWIVAFSSDYFAAPLALKAAKGANSDITSLLGLTTPLSVAQGGTGSTTAASAPTMTVFTASGTYTKPAGLKAVRVRLVGGGGGGNQNGNLSAGGGGGGYSEKIILAASLGATETVTVGAGGAAQSTTTPGITGGTSSFGAHCSATGGAGGGTAGSSIGGNGGTGTGGTINTTGSDGTGNIVVNTVTMFGGGSVFGGSSTQTGKNYGGGGGRDGSTSLAYAGAAGVVIVEEFF